MILPRNSVDAMLDSLEWTPAEPSDVPNPDGLPTVTHRGVLSIAGFRLRVMRLSDGSRVIDAEDLERFLGAAMDRLGDPKGDDR